MESFKEQFWRVGQDYIRIVERNTDSFYTTLRCCIEMELGYEAPPLKFWQVLTDMELDRPENWLERDYDRVLEAMRREEN